MITYIENVFFCLAAPLIVAIFCVPRYPRRSLLFILSGMVACLFSSYISSSFARSLGASTLEASLEISPLVEEVLKLVPVAFYLMVYEPEKNEAAGEALMIAVGFATLENVCYLLTTDANNTLRLLIRGFSTGAIVMRGLWKTLLFRVVATLGVLCLSITCHGIYNILVNQDGVPAMIGYILPLIIGAGTIIARRRIYGSQPPERPQMPENV